MPSINLHTNIDKDTLKLIQLESEAVQFDESKGDYIEVNVKKGDASLSGQNPNVVGGLNFYSNQTNMSENGKTKPQVVVYRDKVSKKIFIKPSEILKDNNFTSTGDFTFRVNFYRNILNEIFVQPENLLLWSEDYSKTNWEKSDSTEVMTLIGEDGPEEGQSLSVFEYKENMYGGGTSSEPVYNARIFQQIGLTETLVTDEETGTQTALSTGPLKNNQDYVYSVWVKSSGLPTASSQVKIGMGVGENVHSVLFDIVNDSVIEQYDCNNSINKPLAKITHWQNGWKKLEIGFHTDYKNNFNLNTEGSNPVDDIPVQQLLTQDMKYQVFIQLNDDYYFESDRTLLIYGSQLQQGVFDEGYIKTENLIAPVGVEVEEQLRKNPSFYIKQISDSRKEVRLLFHNNNNDWKGFDAFYGSDDDPYYFEDFDINKDGIINEQDAQEWNAINRSDIAVLITEMINDNNFPEHAPKIMDKFSGLLGKLSDSTFDFSYVISYKRGSTSWFKENLITNYHFDKISLSPKTSLILRLNNPLPGSIRKKQSFNILKKLMDEHQFSFKYEAARPEFFSGGPLTVDDFFIDEGEIIPESEETYEAYNDLTSSITEDTLQQVSSSFNYAKGIHNKNLNINYNEFHNHVVFGSARQKLVNFRTKVKNIEDKLVKLSQSLSLTGSYALEERKKCISDTNEILETFTHYEKFLYYDNQLQSTASAPSLGKNLAPPVPVSKDAKIGTTDNILLEGTNVDGFQRVFEHNSTGSSDAEVGIFTGKYYSENPPFYSYSGSVYVSWLMKAHSDVSMSLRNKNNLNLGTSALPSQSWAGNWLEKPNLTGSEYRRFVVQASQSYWRPTTNVGYDANFIQSNSATHWEILSGSNITGSYPIKDSSGLLPTHPAITSSVNFFSGSIKPSGELFNIYYLTGSNISSSFITDVKVTYSNPTSSLPFGQMYRTSSLSWQNWYDGALESASRFDQDNIHSLFNNIPNYLREDEDSGSLKTYLGMMGEHFDLIRNYTDTLSTIHNRNYTNYTTVSGSDELTVPQDLLPILAENFGWDFVQPFSSSFASYFQTLEGTDMTLQELNNVTWTKILNNLMHIYKSKGTINSIKSMFNVFGYPSEIINIREFGGSNEESNPSIIDNEVQYTFDIDDSTGNVVYTEEIDVLRSLILDGERRLDLDWQSNEASGESIEFIFKSQEGSLNQELLKSSGSGAENLWDLRLLTSGSSGSLGKLEFRLNNSYTGGLDISTNAYSMSTAYVPLKDGHYWNVMLQRMTGSTDSTISQSYYLWTGVGNGTTINHLTTGSMTINGTELGGKGSSSNYNFVSTGSVATTVSGNLKVGSTMTGSICEFHLWGSALSGSKFKQHILNKKGAGGNTIDSSNEELIYQYRLNEGYDPGTDGENLKINDAKYFTTKDYTRILPNIFTSSMYVNNYLYAADNIDIVKLSVRLGGDEHNSNKIVLTTNSESKWIRDLNPFKPSIEPDWGNQENKRNIDNTRIEIVRSHADTIDKYILNNMPDGDVTDKFGDPRDRYEPRYYDLETLKKTYYTGLDVNINKYIGAQAKLLTQAVIKNVKKLLPARVDLDRVGVTIKPTILERNKVKHLPMSVDYEDIFGEHKFEYVSFDKIPYNNFEGIQGFHMPSLSGSEYPNYSGQLTFSIWDTTGEYRDDSGELKVDDFIFLSGSTRDLSGVFDLNSIYNISSRYRDDTGEYSLFDAYKLTSSYETLPGAELHLPDNFNFESLYRDIKNTKTIDLDDWLVLTGSEETIQSGSSISLFDIASITSNYFNRQGQISLYSTIEEFGKEIINPLFDVDGENISPKTSLIALTGSQILSVTGSYLDKDGTTSVYDTYTFEGDNIVYGDAKYDSGSIIYLQDYIGTGEAGSIKKWGRDFDQSWFLNEQPNQSLSGSVSTNGNTWHIDNRYTFRLIGDIEYRSGSFLQVTKSVASNLKHKIQDEIDKIWIFNDDFTDANNHKNRELRDDALGSYPNDYTNFVSTYKYESFIGNGAHSGTASINLGRPVGRTYYFATSSDGDIIYPVNHYRKVGTSKSAPWMNRLCYGGVKNGTTETVIVKGTKGLQTETRYNSTLLQAPDGASWIDLSTASFYTVNVTGKNKLKVQRGFNTLGQNNNEETQGGGGQGGTM